MGLNYRGYAIQGIFTSPHVIGVLSDTLVDLAEHCIFEEVSYLLIHGSLPTQKQLDSCMGGPGSAAFD